MCRFCLYLSLYRLIINYTPLKPQEQSDRLPPARTLILDLTLTHTRCDIQVHMCILPDKDAAPHVRSLRLYGKFTAQPHVRRTCGKREVWIFFGDFFFQNRRLENSSVGQKKTFFFVELMKNVCFLCALVLKIKYKQKCEDKI